MNAPDAALHIVSGIYELEGGKTRWTAGTAVLRLKNPAQPQPVQVQFYIPSLSTRHSQFQGIVASWESS